jgi:hypothetical protein
MSRAATRRAIVAAVPDKNGTFAMAFSVAADSEVAA